MADEKANLGQIKIPRQKKGSTPILLVTDYANQIIGLCEALSNIEVRTENSDGSWNTATATLTDKKLIIEIPYNNSDGTS